MPRRDSSRILWGSNPVRTPIYVVMKNKKEIHTEVLTATQYYGRPSPGWVILRDGKPHHTLENPNVEQKLETQKVIVVEKP